jgi:uncharacterized protein (TIGR02145 family)
MRYVYLPFQLKHVVMKKTATILFLIIAMKALANTDSLEFLQVKIGSQVWLNANLSSLIFRNGEKIFYAKNNAEWDSANMNKIAACAHAEFDTKNAPNGLHYNQYAILDERNICPKGYRIPLLDDWNVLFTFLKDSVADKLKSQAGWDTKCFGCNSTGFNAKPNGKFVCNKWGEGLTTSAYFWYKTVENKTGSIKMIAGYRHVGMPRLEDCYGFSVRCIKE